VLLEELSALRAHVVPLLEVLGQSVVLAELELLPVGEARVAQAVDVVVSGLAVLSIDI